jgi:hypothetical protein
MLYAMGFTLPAKYDEWVFRDLTRKGWIGRELIRVECLGLPFAIACLVFLPGAWVIRACTAFFFLVGPPFVTSFYVTEWRDYRLRQHELLPPGDNYTQRYPPAR